MIYLEKLKKFALYSQHEDNDRHLNSRSNQKSKHRGNILLCYYIGIHIEILSFFFMWIGSLIKNKLNFKSELVLNYYSNKSEIYSSTRLLYISNLFIKDEIMIISLKKKNNSRFSWLLMNTFRLYYNYVYRFPYWNRNPFFYKICPAWIWIWNMCTYNNCTYINRGKLQLAAAFKACCILEEDEVV